MLTCANIRAMPERPGPIKPADTEDLELHMLIRALMAMTDHRKRMAVLSFITFASLC
jgi:hypothetical protein